MTDETKHTLSSAYDIVGGKHQGNEIQPAKLKYPTPPSRQGLIAQTYHITPQEKHALKTLSTNTGRSLQSLQVEALTDLLSKYGKGAE